jgi:tRNA-Thr(GGU) m(6)t(6)A37 methyltransferase TsaA
MQLQQIGIIRTPYKSVKDMPVQPVGAGHVIGSVELNPELAEGLVDLEGFSHILVIYGFHRIAGSSLTVTPFLDHSPHGVFATRAPARPNPLGLSLLQLVGITGTILQVAQVDMLDGTPLFDIKPYVPAFDQPVGKVRSGWLEETAGAAARVRSDGRFDKE